jgi:hypothetical protein
MRFSNARTIPFCNFLVYVTFTRIPTNLHALTKLQHLINSTALRANLTVT